MGKELVTHRERDGPKKRKDLLSWSPHALLKTGALSLLCSIQEPFFFFRVPNTSTLSLSSPPSKKEYFRVYNMYKKILILKGTTKKDRGGFLATNCLPRDRQEEEVPFFSNLSRKLRKGDGGSDSLPPPLLIRIPDLVCVVYSLYSVCPPSSSSSFF